MLEVCFNDSMKGTLCYAQRIRAQITAGELRVVEADDAAFYHTMIARAE